MSSSGYKTTRTGLSLGTGFEQYQDIFVNFDISNYYEKLVTSDSATDTKKGKKEIILKTYFYIPLHLTNLIKIFNQQMVFLQNLASRCIFILMTILFKIHFRHQSIIQYRIIFY